MSNKRSRNSAVEQDRSMIEGLEKYLGNQPLIVGRQTYQPQEIIDVVAERVATGQAILDARVALTAAIKADEAARKKTSAFMQSIKGIAQAMFADVPEALAVFGLKPRKTPKKTVAVKVAAAAKGLATKKARGYMGKKQRKRITGKTGSPAPQAVQAATAVEAPAPKVEVPAAQVGPPVDAPVAAAAQEKPS